MTLIKCSADCIYQQDGYCTNDEEKMPDGILQLSLSNGCVYFSEKSTEITAQH